MEIIGNALYFNKKYDCYDIFAGKLLNGKPYSKGIKI
jgi:hypothetical protein